MLPVKITNQLRQDICTTLFSEQASHLIPNIEINFVILFAN
jgi:hypothetical protein